MEDGGIDGSVEDHGGDDGLGESEGGFVDVDRNTGISYAGGSESESPYNSAMSLTILIQT